MKLTDDQAEVVRKQLVAHIAMNNTDAIECHTRCVDNYPLRFSLAEAYNAMLEAGDPYLTKLVQEMVTDRLGLPPLRFRGSGTLT